MSGLVNVYTLVLLLVRWWCSFCCLFLWQWATVSLTVVVAAVVVAVAMVAVAAGTAAMAVVAAVAVVAGAFNGGRWRHRLMEATQQPAGAHRQDKRMARREDERVMRQELTQQPAGARRQEGGAVRGQQEGSATRGQHNNQPAQ